MADCLNIKIIFKEPALRSVILWAKEKEIFANGDIKITLVNDAVVRMRQEDILFSYIEPTVYDNSITKVYTQKECVKWENVK